MNYKIPNWYGNKRIDFAHITDQELVTLQKTAQQFQSDNRELHAQATQICNQMVANATIIFGERSDAYKDVRRASRKVPMPPDLVKAYNKLRENVLVARQSETRLVKQRVSNRAYYQRQKQLSAELYDAAILEGGNGEMDQLSEFETVD